MNYSFKPLTDEELDAYDLVEDGVYTFEVIKSTFKVSRSNRDMAELQINIWDHSGKIYTVFDYLVFSDIKMNIRKVSHFAKSVGLYEEYKKGSLPIELERLSGKVQIGTQEATSNSNGGFFPKKNIVIDYIVPASNDVEIKSVEVKKDAEFNDDIPF